MIPQLVESYLDEYVPRSLREAIDKNRDELSAIHSQLHNELGILCTHAPAEFC